MISQVLFTSEQPKENKMAFVAILSQIKLLFGPLIIQLVWYILKQLFTSVSVKVVDIYLAASRLGKYAPLFTSTSVKNRSARRTYVTSLNVAFVPISRSRLKQPPIPSLRTFTNVMRFSVNFWVIFGHFLNEIFFKG